MITHKAALMMTIVGTIAAIFGVIFSTIAPNLTGLVFPLVAVLVIVGIAGWVGLIKQEGK